MNIFAILGAVLGAVAGAIVGRHNAYSKLNKYNLLGERENDTNAKGMSKTGGVMVVLAGIVFILIGLWFISIMYVDKSVQSFGVLMVAMGALVAFAGIKSIV